MNDRIWPLVLLILAVAALCVGGAVYRVTGGERLLDPQPKAAIRVLP